MKHVKAVTGDMKADLLWRMVAIGDPDQCWPWLGTKTSHGYGVAQRNGRRILAHRVAFAIKHGDITSGLVVRHKCDNPSCVNPNHLEVGTQADNLQDCRNRGRRADGERHPMAKLTTRAVWAIRSGYAAGGVSMSQLAATHGVGIRTIHAVVHCQRWKDVVFRP